MDVMVLGPVEVLREGVRVPIGGPKQRSILALLAAHVGSSLSLDQIVESIYGDEANDGARRSARTFISMIRRELGDAVVKGGSGYSLVLDPTSIDAVQFEDQVRTAIPLLAEDPETTALSLRQALALWRGPPYTGVDSTAVFAPEIVRLDELRLMALETRIDADLASGRHRELVGELDALITEHPLHERFRAQHMLTLYRCGRQADALRAFARARTYLADELGIDPTSDLRDLELRVLEQDPDLDLREVLPVRGNLPERLSAFVGRSEETMQVEKLVGQHRLVTLTGLGGIGKTALAVEVARRMEDTWADGAWLIKLAPITDPTSVVSEIARVLDVAEHPTRSLLEVTVDELASRSVLLVVDNCEHVIDEAARVIDTLTERCAGISVLATSREPLQILGERIWVVRPLAIPDVDTESSAVAIAEYDAVRLFVDRAQEIASSFVLDRTNFAEVGAICRRLDGIPLALELAAARLRALSPSQLLERLQDRFSILTGGGRRRSQRQQTLLATMDWSYDLLSASERIMLRRLAVFQGGFTLVAAEGVCSGDGIELGDVLDHISRLLAASLLTRDAGEPGRFGMLESVRQYATSLLSRSGEESTIRRRHADYFCDLVAVEPDFDSAEFGEMLERVADEPDNFRGAVAWTVDAEDGDRALRLAVILANRWFFSSQVEETVRWIPRVLRIADPAPSSLRIRLLQFLATHLMHSGRRRDALAVIIEAEVLAEQLDETRANEEAVFTRAMYLDSGGDVRGSYDFLLEHFQTTRQLRDPYATLNVGLAGLQAVVLGDFETAVSLTRELEERATALGQPMASAWADGNWAMLAHYQGDLATAEQKCRESLAALAQLGRAPEAETIRELGQVALARGEIESATGWARRLIDIGRGNLVTTEMADGHVLLARIALREGLVSEAGRATADALELAVASGDLLALAGVLSVAGQHARASGEAETAVLLYSGGEALRETIGFIHPAPRAQELRTEYTAIRKTLGSKPFESAWDEGALLDPETMVARAQALLGASGPTD